jgi:hypothetical protein
MEGTLETKPMPGKHGLTGGRGKTQSVDFGQLGLLFALALLFWRLRS